MAEIQKWEYKTIFPSATVYQTTILRNFKQDKFEKSLNRYGNEGWEIVGFSHIWEGSPIVGILKRKI